MNPSSRPAWRLRLMRSYEITLYALLLALGVAVALPAPPAEADEGAEAAPLQCGKAQSSAVVIIR